MDHIWKDNTSGDRRDSMESDTPHTEGRGVASPNLRGVASPSFWKPHTDDHTVSARETKSGTVTRGGAACF